MRLRKTELTAAIEDTPFRGSLDQNFSKLIDISVLEKIVVTCASIIEVPSAFNMQLEGLLAEAQSVLSYRRAIKEENWIATETIIISDVMSEFSISAAERKFVLKLCNLKTLSRRVERFLGDPINSKSTSGILEQINNKIEDIEILMVDLEGLMEFEPTLIETSKHFHDLAYSCWSCYNLFVSIKSEQWGVEGFVMGTAFDFSQCPDEFLCDLLDYFLSPPSRDELSNTEVLINDDYPRELTERIREGSSNRLIYFVEKVTENAVIENSVIALLCTV